MNEQCCGTCKWHKYNKSGEDWECSNIFADDCGDYTPYVHYCEEYEERE